jgi:hypothetical protein
MKAHPIFFLLWRLVNVGVILFALLLPLTAAWEFFTRQYVKGFASAIVVPGSGPEARVTAIMSWMGNNSVRSGTNDTDLVTVRDPENTLTSGKLLRICGSATNAFVNLANAAGVPARRLLLLDSWATANHVVAEVELDGRWHVVDPVFHIIPHDSSGQWLTASDLHDSAVLASITRNIPAYRPDYNYQKTAHLRLGRIPVFGPLVGRILNRLWPGWDGAIFWTLLTERESFAALIGAIFLLVVFFMLRIGTKTYGRRRLELSNAELACPWNRQASMHLPWVGES